VSGPALGPVRHDTAPRSPTTGSRRFPVAVPGIAAPMASGRTGALRFPRRSRHRPRARHRSALLAREAFLLG